MSWELSTPIFLNKDFNWKFLVLYPDHYTPGEDRRAQRPKRWGYNKKDKDNSLNMNSVNINLSVKYYLLQSSNLSNI